MISRDYI